MHRSPHPLSFPAFVCLHAVLALLLLPAPAVRAQAAPVPPGLDPAGPSAPAATPRRAQERPPEPASVVPADFARELLRDPAAFADQLAENGLALDLAGRTVAVRGGTLHDRTSLGYPVEYLVVTDRGRTHEALFVVKTKPSVLDACLRALGLQPGTPMRFQLKDPQPPEEDVAAGKVSPWDPVPASGPLLAIDVTWTDDAGAPHRQRLESLLLDARDGSVLPEMDWVYTGSGFGTIRQGKQDVQAFIADLQGDVVAIYLNGQGAALCERNSLDGVDDTLYVLNPDTMPARGTPVTLVFSPTGRSAPPPPPRAAPAVVNGEVGARLDAFLTRLVPWGFSGAVAVERGGEVLLSKGYGLADRATGLAASTSTAFPLSSLGKQFTAALVLQLAAEEKLGLDDSIAKHLKDVPEDKAAITVRQLLGHTSGLPENEAVAPTTSDRNIAVAAVLATPLAGTPGERFAYSNAGYLLLAAIAESAGSDSFRSLLAERIFGPANLTDTGLYGEPLWDASQVAHGYRDGAEDLQAAVEANGPSGTALGRDLGTPASGPLAWRQVGAGAVVSTVRDMLRWQHALRDGKVLPPEQVALMLTPGAGEYGCAWWITDGGPGRGKLAWHDGILPGFRTEVRRYLDADTLVIVAGNSELNGVANPLAAIAFGEDVPLPPEVQRTLSTPLPPPAKGTVRETEDRDGARGVLRDGAAEAGKVAGTWVDGATRAPLFTLQPIGGELLLVPSSDEVYEKLGPALGFKATTLKDRMTRRGGLRLLPVAIPENSSNNVPPLEWAAFEAHAAGTIVLQGGASVGTACEDGVTLWAAGAAAGAAPLLAACRAD